MITDSIIKQKFILDGLRDAAESAFRFQLNAFRNIRKSRSGDTLRTLENPDFTVRTAGDGEFIVTASIAKQLRLQDLGVRSLYTRPLYGALRHIHGRLHYGLGDEIRAEIRRQLENALNLK